jgi:predicted patatin/cPLA2 family phospholipase
MKIGIVTGPGGTRSYVAGVVQVLIEEKGPDVFYRGYGVSSGVYPLMFLFSDQSSVHEDLWRWHIAGFTKLIKFYNPFLGRPILDLDYLFRTFSCLGSNYEAIVDSGKLFCVVTNLFSGQPEYLCLSSVDDLHVLGKATSAIPWAHPPVSVRGVPKFDGWFGDPLPVERALEDGCDRVIVVLNYPEHAKGDRLLKRFLGWFPPRSFRGLQFCMKDFIADAHAKQQKAEEFMEKNRHRVFVVRPSLPLPFRSPLDANERTMNHTFDLGMTDGQAFLKRYDYMF